MQVFYEQRADLRPIPDRNGPARGPLPGPRGC